MNKRSETGLSLPWAWLGFGSVLQTLLLAALFTVPFHHLWAVMPAPAPIGGPGASGDPEQALGVAIIFGIPTLLPFVLFVRRPSALLPATLPALTVAVAVGLVLLPALAALLTYPCCTSDVMDYINRQRLWTVYGGNPFSVVANDHPEDWSYYLSHFRDGTFNYGPLWWIAVRAFTQWATNLGEYLIGLKVLAAVCFGVSARLVWLLSPPAWRLHNLVFFAWNPIVLVDGLLRLHNDLLTVPFVLAAVWLWQRRPAWALPLVALGALVKLIVAPVGLVVLALLVKSRDWRAIVVGSLASVLVAVALYAPFWYGLGTLASLVTQVNVAQWSVGAVLLSVAQPLLGDVSAVVVRLSLLVACVVLMGRCVQQLVSAPIRSVARLADCATLVLLIGILTIPMTLFSHYLTPVIGLAAVAADRRVRSLVLALAFGTMVNALLGVDSLAGGLAGAPMEAAGSLVLFMALGLGLVRGWWLRGPSAGSAPA